MFKHFIFSTITLFAILPVLAQTNTFQKTYGGPGDEEAYSVQQTDDMGYILAGYTTSYGPGSFENAYLVKTDSSGEILWSKTYGKNGGASRFRCVRQTSDGGYIAAGWTFESPIMKHDILLVKTDASGNEIWTKKYGDVGCDSAFALELEADGGFLITGSMPDSAHSLPKPFLLKTNSAGAPLIFKTYTFVSGIGETSALSQGKRSFDGGILLVMKTQLDGNAGLVKLDLNGDVLWNKNYGVGSTGIGSPSNGAIVEVNNGFYFCTYASSAGGAEVGLVRLNDTGGVVWGKSFGYNLHERGCSMFQSNDGGIIIGGLSNSFTSGDFDFYLLKVDSSGNFIWSQGYGGDGNDLFYTMVPTSDNGIALTGSSTSFGSGKQIYFIKTDSDGVSGCNTRNSITIENHKSFNSHPRYWTVNTVSTSDSSVAITITPETETDSTHCSSLSVEKIAERRELKVYPNPANNHINLELDRTDIEFMEVSLSDQTGRVVANLFKGAYAAYPGQLNLPEVAPGLYIITLRTDDQKPRQFKLIIQ